MPLPLLRHLGKAAAVLALLAPPALAGGFAVSDQGARGLGLAGAFTAQASDPSAIFHNAAGIAFLRGRQVYAGGTLIAPAVDFTGAAPFPGPGIREEANVGLVVPPSVYYTQTLGGRIAVGAGFNSPFHLKTKWARPETFTGRFISQDADLQTFSVNPTLAYRLADRLAVGAGLDIRLSTLTLRRHVGAREPSAQKVVDAATLRIESGTDIGFGFNVGLLAKPTERLSLGASYRHRVRADLTGSARFQPLPTGNPQLDTVLAGIIPAEPLPLRASVELPAQASLGVAYAWNEWTFEADANWYRWSSFDRVDVVFEGRSDLSGVLVEDYRDSWQCRFGVERALGESFAVRGGYFYDPSPVPTPSVSPLLPDADRHGIALGGSWQGRRWRVDAGSSYVFSPRRGTGGLSRDGYEGTYENSAATLGLSVGYTF